MMLFQEGPVTITLHAVNLTIDGGILLLGLKYLGPALKEYRIYGRIKERLNTLWHKHCEDTGDPYVAVESNGK